MLGTQPSHPLPQANALHALIAPEEVKIGTKKSGGYIKAVESAYSFKRRWGRKAWVVLEQDLRRHVFQELITCGAVKVAVAEQDEAEGGAAGAEEGGAADAEEGGVTGAEAEEGRVVAVEVEAEGGAAGAEREGGDATAKQPQEWSSWICGLCNGGVRAAGTEYKVWVVGSDGLCVCGGSCQLYREAVGWPSSIALVEWNKECYSLTSKVSEELISRACEMCPTYKANYKE